MENYDLEKRIHEILQKQIDMGMFNNKPDIRGGVLVGGNAEKDVLKHRAIADLRKMAKKLGIKRYSQLSKRQLINAIVARPVEVTGKEMEFKPVGYLPGIDISTLEEYDGGCDDNMMQYWMKMNVKQLKGTAKEYGLKGYSKLRKIELIMLLSKVHAVRKADIDMMVENYKLMQDNPVT